MPVTALMLVRGAAVLGAIAIGLTLYHWSVQQNLPPSRQVKIQQTWELEPGQRVGDYRVVGGLGDISIDLQGNKVWAPFAGDVYPLNKNCVLFSSPEVPAYLLRLCGVQQVNFGAVSQGGRIAKSQILHFATLRKQPDGSWAIVEPSREVLERVLNPQRT